MAGPASSLPKVAFTVFGAPGSRVSAPALTPSVPQTASSPAGAGPRSVTVKPSSTKSAPSGAPESLRSPVQVSPQPAVTVRLNCPVVRCCPIGVARVSVETALPPATRS